MSESSKDGEKKFMILLGIDGFTFAGVISLGILEGIFSFPADIRSIFNILILYTSIGCLLVALITFGFWGLYSRRMTKKTGLKIPIYNQAKGTPQTRIMPMLVK